MVPKKSASSCKALLAQPAGLYPASWHSLSVLCFDVARGGCQHLFKLYHVSAPLPVTWKDHLCWGQPLVERLPPLLCLQSHHFINDLVKNTQDLQKCFIWLFFPAKGVELAQGTSTFIPRIISLHCRHQGPTCSHVRVCSSNKVFSGWRIGKLKCQNSRQCYWHLTERIC